MKVLLIKDVYKLGRAGDVKKVANGYGRNYLIPQGLAVLATPGALKQVERIRVQADAERVVLNKEMSEVAGKLEGVELIFPVKASETGKLYGSVTTTMIAEAINDQAGTEITRRQVDTQPIRMIGVHQVNIRLTVDLIPDVKVVVHREGEAPETAAIEEAARAGEEVEAFDITEDVAELAEDVEASELVEAAADAETVLEFEAESAGETLPEAETEAVMEELTAEEDLIEDDLTDDETESAPAA
jgi:large subunit ribosomal protein L9